MFFLTKVPGSGLAGGSSYTLIVGFSERPSLDDGADELEDTLISGTGGAAIVGFGRSSIVCMVGTAGEVTALDSGREPVFVWFAVEPYTSSLSSISLYPF
jgi:hypothetical protein